jgi:hypothetical protein
MTFVQKIKQPQFWNNLLKVAIPFFIIVTLFSLFINSWKQIFAGDWAAVSEFNFDNGKWKIFWGTKVVICFIYGMYVTNKNMK